MESSPHEPTPPTPGEAPGDTVVDPTLPVVATGSPETATEVTDPAAAGLGDLALRASIGRGEALIGNAWDHSAVAVSGLRRAWAGRRVRRLSQKERSGDVHKEVARAVIESRSVDSDLLPVTLSQKSQHKRADKRHAKANVNRINEQYRLARTYGTEISEESYGTDAKEAHRAGLISRKEKGGMIKAREEFAKVDKKVKRLSGHEAEGLVRQSAEGMDRPGLFLRMRSLDVTRRKANAQRHYDKLAEASQQRRDRIATRRRLRKAR